MCLTKRIAPCDNCVSFLKLSQTMDLIEDKMDNNEITEGTYLKDMDQMKNFYDRVTEFHKIDGCSDCITDDDDDDDDDSDYEIVEVSVDADIFEWRGNEYAMADALNPSMGGDRFETRRILYDMVPPHPAVGHVTHVGEVIIY